MARWADLASAHRAIFSTPHLSRLDGSVIVTVEHSDVIGGTVARWYGTYHEWHDRRAFIEVSCGGVHVHGYFDLFPEGAIDAALEAFHTLQRKHGANMDHLATHEVVMGDLIAIVREPVPAADGKRLESPKQGCLCVEQCRGQHCQCECHEMPSHGDKGE